MSQIENLEAPGPCHSEAMTLQLLEVVSQLANSATSIESLFRNLGRQLLSGQMADAVSLLVYDGDGARITELLLMTDIRHFNRTSFSDLAFGGLSISGTEASGRTAPVKPRVIKAPR
jgi:hypothetical protein